VFNLSKGGVQKIFSIPMTLEQGKGMTLQVAKLGRNIAQRTLWDNNGGRQKIEVYMGAPQPVWRRVGKFYVDGLGLPRCRELWVRIPSQRCSRALKAPSDS
jgi:hypothetical protein